MGLASFCGAHRQRWAESFECDAEVGAQPMRKAASSNRRCSVVPFGETQCAFAVADSTELSSRAVAVPRLSHLIAVHTTLHIANWIRGLGTNISCNTLHPGLRYLLYSGVPGPRAALLWQQESKMQMVAIVQTLCSMDR
jgi:hypothetical protein